MITSLIEVLELPNLFVDDVMDTNYDFIIFILRRPRVAIFGDIIKNVTIFIK